VILTCSKGSTNTVAERIIGWPDSANLWRNQIPFLVANGFRAIAPDLRGFGASERPEGVAAYSLRNAVGDVVGILDAFDIATNSRARLLSLPGSEYMLRYSPLPVRK
jgi:alpha-beta hydrolase superfamily lysophospholipase